MTDLETAARLLEASPDYRVLRRISPGGSFALDDGEERKLGIIVDVETTGLDPTRHKVIELGIVAFLFGPAGQIYGATSTFTAFQDPGSPLDAEIVDLTGITDEMLAGQAIDPAAVAAFVEPAAVVIAHNAAFDRPFCERAWPCFTPKAWACSLHEIDWKAERQRSGKLEALLAAHGLFHDGHRAFADCHALIEILARPLPHSGRPALQALLEVARRPTYRIRAVASPFEAKDVLKARGYRWEPGDNGRTKCWWRDVPEADRDAEIEWLQTAVYRYSFQPPVDRITAWDRHSERAQ